MKKNSFLCFAGFCFLYPILLLGNNIAPGYVIGWGYNVSGAATGSVGGKYSTGTVTIAGQILTNAVAISAGLSHSLALRADGTVVGWGNNMSGRAIGIETGFPFWTNGLVKVDGEVLSNAVAISAYQYSLAMQRDGKLIAWGSDSTGKKPIIPDDFRNAIDFATSLDYSLALKRNGIVVGTANLGNNVMPDGLSNVVAIATSAASTVCHSLALKNDGTIVEWHNWNEHTSKPIGLTNIVAIAASATHSLVLKKDGTADAWGFGKSGAANVPSGLSNVVAIAVGKNSDVYSSDYNAFSLALKNNGTVVAWGKMFSQPAIVPDGLSNVVAMAAGEGFCLAITTNRAVAERFKQSQR